jgi:hypothetical protein
VCSDCLVEDAPPQQKDRVYFEQFQHHRMRDLVGQPPGTLIAWYMGLFDRSGKLDQRGEPISYPAGIYAVCVERWQDAWPQRRFPWSLDPESPWLVILSARVIAVPEWGNAGSWLFSWWWPQPNRREACQLDPPDVSLTDDEAVRLNRARGAFYAWRPRRGRTPGGTVYTSQQLEVIVPRERAEFQARRGRPPHDTELAPLIGVSEATLKRYKRKGMIPPP